MEEARTFRDRWILCPECHRPLAVEDESFVRYFEGQPEICTLCRTKVDLWPAVQRTIAKHFLVTGAFQMVGAQLSTFVIKLRSGETSELDFTHYGVAEGATILGINYSPVEGSDGHVLPLEVYGNRPIADPVPVRRQVYARPGGTVPPTEGEVSVTVTWIAPEADDTATRHLVDAARDYSAARYERVIVPANIAVESSLTPVLSGALRGFCSKENSDDFLTNGATYSNQLNVVVPMLSHMIGVSPMPDTIRGTLNRLRGLRNEIAHRGRAKKPVTKENAAELLAAAVFGFHYTRFFGRGLLLARKHGRLPGSANAAGGGA